jgi:hypothetical protein
MNFENLKVSELREYAKTNKVNLHGAKKKEDIIKILKNINVNVNDDLIKIYFKYYFNIENFKKQLLIANDQLWDQGYLTPNEYQNNIQFINLNCEEIKKYINDAITKNKFKERNTGKMRNLLVSLDYADFFNEVLSIKDKIFWQLLSGVTYITNKKQKAKELKNYCNNISKLDCKSPCKKSLLKGCTYEL